MENKKKIVEISAYMSVLQELLEQGKEVSLTITGNSMSPFLIHGRDAILLAPANGCWKKGDMAFYRRTGGQYVMHRICRVNTQGECFFVGDAQQEVEGPIREDQIFAKVISVRRKNRWIGPGDFWWEFFAHFWINVIPLRKIFRKIYGVLWNIRKKCATLWDI